MGAASGKWQSMPESTRESLSCFDQKRPFVGSALYNKDPRAMQRRRARCGEMEWAYGWFLWAWCWRSDAVRVIRRRMLSVRTRSPRTRWRIFASMRSKSWARTTATRSSLRMGCRRRSCSCRTCLGLRTRRIRRVLSTPTRPWRSNWVHRVCGS